ncbi:MAG: rhodanese-related sulfurtransferase [Nanoarchaeota archaeon]|nr:rhodanese-related sulfurtransferase [Nanoarchaeota archaeon]
MEQDIHILLFYKFVNLGSMEKLEEFRRTHLEECERIGLKGRILIAEEGINGSVSGTKGQIEKYKILMHSKLAFSDLWFKGDVGTASPFTKMTILVRDEIVALKKKVDLGNTGNYLSPEEILELYDSDGHLKENIIFMDARNDYEHKIGKFKDSIQVNTKTFREFPEKAKGLEKIKGIKDKKIVMYCTGGIRCEKASVVLKEAGFKDVNQIHGGIINFVQKYPDTFWEGKLFVFDKRMVADVNNENKKPITECEVCSVSCDLYKNCRNPECDRFVVLCLDCQFKLHGCCSQECFLEFQEYCTKKSLVNQGRKTQVAI